MNKKGTSIGMVFIFMVAAITFALIMIFGYKAISGFLGDQEKIEFVQFKNDLERNIKGIYTEFSTVRIETFYPPARYERICFVDMDTPYPGDVECEQSDLDPVACDAWGTWRSWKEADRNVFLKPIAPVEIKVYKIEVEGGEGVLCLPVTKGKFKLRLEGRGDKTKISIPES